MTAMAGRRLCLLLAMVYPAPMPIACAAAANWSAIGDRAFEVEQKCGTPRERDLLGYGIDRQWQGRYDYRLEEWVYGPYSGMYYFLQFKGNRLIRIETRRSR